MIDIMNILLMNMISNNNIKNNILSYEMILLIIIIGIINLLKDNRLNFISQSIKYIYDRCRSKYTIIEITGWESLNDGLYTFEYPKNMTAINYYIYTINKSNNFRYFNNKRNGLYFADSMKDTIENDELPNYILGDVSNIMVEDNIYISVTTDDSHNNISDKNTILNWKILMKIISYKKDTLYIQEFINKCIIKYDKHISDRNKNKIYHFIYQGKKNNKLSFSSKIISDLNDENLQNYETFNNIFHKNKNQIIKDIDKLHDIDYYKRTGLKRKKGYMFYGTPGTGKTSTVMAMSNYDKRHIIEVPINRVQTNNELEAILNINCINSIEFKQDNIIILFDELDITTKANIEIIEPDILKKNITKKNKSYTYDNDSDDEHHVDKLNISTLLSRFDGIGNYAGLIIIATTNNIDDIDSALYRDGRLNLIKFENASSNDINNILEKYYECKLDQELIELIKTLDNKISHAKIRCKLEYYSTPESLIKDLLVYNI
jgi:ATP-dependent 26S proteasome regulatory subunit